MVLKLKRDQSFMCGTHIYWSGLLGGEAISITAFQQEGLESRLGSFCVSTVQTHASEVNGYLLRLISTGPSAVCLQFSDTKNRTLINQSECLHCVYHFDVFPFVT